MKASNNLKEGVMEDAMEQERSFKGIWIEKELYLAQDLSWTEKILYKEIDSLDNKKGCFASNAYLAEFLGVKEVTVSNAISKLKSLGLVKQESFNGRTRILRSCPAGFRKLRGRVLKSIRQTFKNHKESNIDEQVSMSKLSLPKGKDKDESKIRHRPLLNTSSSDRPAKTPDLLPKQKLPKTQLAYENASSEARDIVDSWNELPTTSTHRKSSKSVRNILKLLDSKLLKKHGADAVKRCMVDFSMMQQNASLYKVPVSKTSIDTFFIGSNGYMTHYRKQRGQTVEPSWFDKLILAGSFSNYLREANPNSELTSEFKRLYEKHIAGEKPEFYTPKQEGQFVAASALLKRCMDRGRLGKCIDGAGVVDYILHFLRALDEEWGASKVRIWHLGTVDSWNSVFPRYITRHWKEI